MTKFALRIGFIAALITATGALTACTSDQVIDNTVGVAAGTGKMVGKAAIGAGKLAYKGGKAVLTDED
ncbi:hypothetical protein [Mesobacterium pallidum]|uniref:hypothetical protein n=1 Tax=Mesobacterium pallidum TaxID=2872037 RepID=UPI001EE24666|nr:hypothetical protein [Mesobacterium pallidum]